MQIKTTSLKGTMDLPGITAFKVISMLMVFLFHQNINLGLSVSQDFLDSSIYGCIYCYLRIRFIY